MAEEVTNETVVEETPIQQPSVESPQVEAVSVETTSPPDDDKAKRIQAVYKMLDSDDVYQKYVPKTYDEFAKKLATDGKYAQGIYKMVSNDEDYSKYLPATFEETANYFGLGKQKAEPAKKPSQSLGGQSPSKRGVEFGFNQTVKAEEPQPVISKKERIPRPSEYAPKPQVYAPFQGLIESAETLPKREKVGEERYGNMIQELQIRQDQELPSYNALNKTVQEQAAIIQKQKPEIDAIVAQANVLDSDQQEIVNSYKNEVAQFGILKKEIDEEAKTIQQRINDITVPEQTRQQILDTFNQKVNYLNGIQPQLLEKENVVNQIYKDVSLKNAPLRARIEEHNALINKQNKDIDELEKLGVKVNQNQKAINVLDKAYKREGGQYEKEQQILKDQIFDKRPLLQKVNSWKSETEAALWNTVVPSLVKSLGAVYKLSSIITPIGNIKGLVQSVSPETDINYLNNKAGDYLLSLGKKLEVDPDKLTGFDNPYADKALYDEINPYNFSKGVANVVGSIAMTMAGGAVAGVVGGQAAAFAQIYGNSYQDGIDAGLNNDQALIYAAAIAAPAAVLEEFGVSKLFDLAVTKGGKKILQEAILSELKKNGGKMTAKEIFDFTTKKITQFISSGTVEGLVELSQTSAEFLTKLGTEAITTADFEGNLDMTSFKKQAYDSFVLGYSGGAASSLAIQTGPQKIVEVAAQALSAPEEIKKFRDNLESLRISGNIDAQGYAVANDALNKAIDVSKTVPATITNVDDRAAAINLINKRDELTTQLEGVDADLAAPIQEELKNVKAELQDLAKGVKPQISEAQGQAITTSEQVAAETVSPKVDVKMKEPTSVTGEDGWTFVRMPNGTYTDGDQIYDSWNALKKVGEDEALGLKQSSKEREKQQRDEETVQEIQDEILNREFKDKLDVWNYINDEALKRMGYESPMDMTKEDLAIHTFLVKKGVEEFEAKQLSTVAEANKIIEQSIKEAPQAEETNQPQTTTENAIQEQPTTQAIPRTGEAGQNIPEGGQGVRPSEQGKETAQQGKEEVKVEENAIVKLQKETPQVQDVELNTIEENLNIGDTVYGTIGGKEVSGKVYDVGVYKNQIVVDIVDQNGDKRFLYSRNIERIKPKEKEVERLNEQQKKRLIELINQEELSAKDLDELGVLNDIRDGKIPNTANQLQQENLTSKETQNETTGKQPVAGNRLFNKPIEAAKNIADRYFKAAFGTKRPNFEGTRKLDKERAKRIATAYQNMKNDPNNPKVKAAYEAMVKETIAQYEEILKDGYFIEINNKEAYANSEEMIEDLRNNKRMKIFSTESGYGDSPITEQQRKENPLLRDSGFKDKNGVPLLNNDIFRAVHDFFGHAELGNSFGALGEENAWNVHSRMYSPLARQAVTSETRGQNSFVNFSNVNAEAQKLFDEAAKLRSEGKFKEALDITDNIYEKLKFAEQKIGLLPEEFNNYDEEKTKTTSTKQQIENFGVAPKDVKAVNSLTEKIFEGLKKSGFTAAKNVKDWLTIKKGEQKNNALNDAISKQLQDFSKKLGIDLGSPIEIDSKSLKRTVSQPLPENTKPKNGFELIKKKLGETAAKNIRESIPYALDYPVEFLKFLEAKIPVKDDRAFLIKEIPSKLEALFRLENDKTIDVKSYDSNKSPEELASEAGFTFHRPKSEEDIMAFKKDFRGGEVLCTYKDVQGRILTNFIFWIRKDGAESILPAKELNQKYLDGNSEGAKLWRKYLDGIGKKKKDGTYDLKNIEAQREDPYGTSSMSVQINRFGGDISIKNRYNHSVNNPDATFGNNLNNIVDGLQEAVYGIEGVPKPTLSGDLPDGVTADSKGNFFRYKINLGGFYRNSTFIGKSGWIKNGRMTLIDKNTQMIMDEYLVDFKNKTITPIDSPDKFLNGDFNNFVFKEGKIEIETKNGNINIELKDGEPIKIEGDIKNVDNNFFKNTKTIESVDLPNVTQIGDNFLKNSTSLRNINLPNVKSVGDNFISNSASLYLKSISLPNVTKIGNGFLSSSYALKNVNLPNVKNIGNLFLNNNNSLKNISLPNVIEVGQAFISGNNNLESVEMPKVEIIGDAFLLQDNSLKSISLPNATTIGNNFLLFNTSLKNVNLPNVKNIKDNFLQNNEDLRKLNIPKNATTGFSFLDNNIKYNKRKNIFNFVRDLFLNKEVGGKVKAQYSIVNGKNVIEAIDDFNKNKNKAEATVTLTHEIMHPTVVAIIDGAAEGNVLGTKHTETIVDEFNKENPNNKITVDELIAGNNAFKEGNTSDQYRAVQEFIAESWEKYHIEGGKGFSEAFQKVLDQITESFREVYKTLSGKQITPELRQMFDEILGKEANLTPNITTNESKNQSGSKENAAKNENGIQEGGTNGNENVSENVQGKGKDGGQNVNVQNEGQLQEVKTTTPNADLAQQGEAATEGAKTETKNETKTQENIPSASKTDKGGKQRVGEETVTEAQDRIAEEEAIEDFVVEEDEDSLNNLFEQINGKPKPPQPLGIVSPAFAAMMQPALPKVKSFVPKAVQERIDTARKTPKEKWYKRASDILTKVHNSFTRMYAALDPKKFADVIDKLRVLKNASEDAKLLAETYLKNLLGPLNLNQRAYLQDYVLLDDLVGSIEDGLYGDVNNQNPLPFGFKDFQEVIDARNAIQAEVDADPKLKAAINKRNDFVNNLYEAAKKAGLTSSEQVGNGRSYFHRQVIKYNSESDMRETVMKTSAERKKLSQFKKRKGSELDYLTNFAEVEYTVIAGTAFEIAKRQAINSIIKPYEAEWKQILAQAKVNAQKIVDDIEAQFGTNSPEHDLAVKNQKDYEISERNALMNPDYVLYKPEGRNTLFRTDVVSGSVVDDALNEIANNNNLGATNILVDNVKYILQAGQGRTMYIPKELAETFDKLGEVKTESDIFFRGVKFIAQETTDFFKKLVLLSPTRLIKYLAGNFAGDIDKLAATNPLVLKKIPSASKEIYDARAKGIISQEYKEAVKYGVIGSGTQVEFGKVDEKAWARFATLSKPTISDYFSLFAKNGLGVKWAYDKWFDLSRGIATSREDAFRFAAYKFALDEIQKGKNIYWFSSKAEIDQITDPKRKAAKLAREIFGDYGAISESGESIAKFLVPFYRFRETNIRGYKNFITNNISTKAGKEKILKYGLARGVTVATTKALVNYSRMVMFTAAVSLFNKLMFPDEEDELQKGNINGFHIITGRDENGNVSYLRSQGTFNAFLESMGLNGIMDTFSDYSNGTATLGEVAAKPGESFVNEFYQGLNPLIKSPIELGQGKSYFPSIKNPRTIRDSPYNLEYLSAAIGQRYLYDVLMDKPRKDKDFLNTFVTNSVNPKEMAYYTTLNFIGGLKSRSSFSVEEGKIDASKLKEEKRNALFEWKQHLKFGNVEKSNDALKRYYDLGGTEKDLKKSVDNLDPLHGLSKFEKSMVNIMLDDKFDIDDLEKSFEKATYNKKTDTYNLTYNRKRYKDVDKSSIDVLKLITKKELDYIGMAKQYYENTFPVNKK